MACCRGTWAIRLLDGQVVRALFPALGVVCGAIHASGAARLRRVAQGVAHQAAILASGARIVVTNHEATLALEGKRVVRVIADNQTFAADKVIIAAGA